MKKLLIASIILLSLTSVASAGTLGNTASIVGSNGESADVFNESLNVHQRFGTQVVNELFHRHTGTSTTLASQADAGDTVLNVTDATGFAAGQHVQIDNGVVESTFPKIISVVSNAITINQPLDNTFPATISTVGVVDHNIKSVAGTLSSPISYILKPPSGEFWLIARIIVTITDQTVMDDAKFGGIGALTNGIVFRGVNGATGATKKFTVWSTNSNMINDVYDLTYSDKAPSGFYGLSARGSFNRIGVEIPLDGDRGDYLEILVQDDLTDLDTFDIKGQGHIHGG